MITGDRRQVITPRDGSVLAEIPWPGVADADAAVAAARRAFDDGPWPRMPARERGEVLLRLADLVEEHREELARLVTLEMGKPITVARDIELRALIRCLRFYGGLADKTAGEVPPTGEGELALVTREPAGVVAAVVPWNFPLTIGGWKFAPALAAAADMAAWAVFFNSGHMCTAGSRLVVHRDVADEVVDRIVASAASWQPDDPLLPATKMGPLASSAGLDRVRLHLARGLEEGASLRLGGSRVHRNGFYLEPTVVLADRYNTLVREELFAPVLTVQTFADEDEALRIAHDTDYGLAAAVWTADLARAHRMSRRLRAGTVWVNCYEEGDMTVPFGGVRQSGGARDKSRHALDQYTDLKTTWISLG